MHPAFPVRPQIAKPAAGETLNITSVPGGNLAFSFDPAAATITRAGNDLVVEVDGGGAVRLNDFFVVGDQPLPSLTMPDGVSVASADFLSSFNIELETAAGPGAGAAGAAGSGAGEYADDAGSLVDGIGRLGSLGTDYWGYESEVTEQFEGLLAGIDAGLPGLPGTLGGDTPPYTPPYTPPTEPVDGPFLHAHSNASGLAVKQGDPIPGESTWVPGKDPYSKSEAFGPDVDSADWSRLRSGGPVQGFGLFSNGSKFDAALTKELGLKINLMETINGILNAEGNQGTAYRAGGDGDAVHTTLSLGAGERITFDWTYDSHNKGGDLEQDAAFCILLNSEGNVAWKGLIAQFDPRGGGAVISSADEGRSAFSVPPAGLEPALPAGNYTLIIGQIEEGNNNGQKPVFTITNLNKVTDYPGTEGHFEYGEPTPTYHVDASGNVIENAIGGSHMNGTDHMVGADGTLSALSDAAFVSLWQFTDPYTGAEVSIPFTEHGQVNTYQPEGASYFLTLHSDGKYVFHMDSEGTAPGLDGWNIQYTVTDGENGEYSDTSWLYLRPEGQILTGDDAVQGVTTGTEGNDVIYAGEEGGVIYGGLGDDILHGGQGEDIFAWKAGDHDGGADKVMDFSFSDGDKLLFEGLTDIGSIDLKLENNVLTLTVPNADGDKVTVEVNFQAGELEAFTTDYAAQHSGNTTGMEQALLQQMIQNAGG